jgi:hypothetical protein
MQVEKRLVLSAEPADAWAVVLDFAAWFCDSVAADEIKPGARAEFAWGDLRRAAVFEEVDEPRHLSFRWLPFARLNDGETVSRPQARVEISLSPVDEGVEVVVVERRLDGALAGATA